MPYNKEKRLLIIELIKYKDRLMIRPVVNKKQPMLRYMTKLGEPPTLKSWRLIAGRGVNSFLRNICLPEQGLRQREGALILT